MNESILRLARRAGIMFLDVSASEAIELKIQEYLKNIIKKALTFMHYEKRKTLMVDDIFQSLPHIMFSSNLDGKTKKLIKPYIGLEKTIIKNEIEKYQNSKHFLIQKSLFETMVKNIISDFRVDFRVSKDSFLLLQHSIENCLDEVLKDANILSILEKTNVVNQIDIIFAYKKQNLTFGLDFKLEDVLDFNEGIVKILINIYPEIKISDDALSQLNLFLNILAMKLTSISNLFPGKTIEIKTIRYATENLFEDELGRKIIQFALKIITEITGTNPINNLSIDLNPVEIILRKYGKRIGENSIYYLASVIEYVCSKFLEITGNMVKDRKSKIITSSYLLKFIESDNQFKILSKNLNFRIINGGTIPFDLNI